MSDPKSAPVSIQLTISPHIAMYRSIVLVMLALVCFPFRVNAEELTRQQIQTILNAANTWKGTPYKFAGKDRDGIDCSHFVHTVYRQALADYKYRMAEDYLNDREFSRTNTPQPGDLIVFTAVNGLSAHVGIVTNPEQQKFIGAQSSTGVKETTYVAKSYWGKRPYMFLTLQARSNFIANRSNNNSDSPTSSINLRASASLSEERVASPKENSGKNRKNKFTLHPLEVSETDAMSLNLFSSNSSPRTKSKIIPSESPRKRVKSKVANNRPVAYRVNIQSARQRLPELIEAAEQGTEVLIRDDRGNTFRLLPIRR